MAFKDWTQRIIEAVVCDLIAGGVLYAIKDSADETKSGGLIWNVAFIGLIFLPWIVLLIIGLKEIKSHS